MDEWPPDFERDDSEREEHPGQSPHFDDRMDAIKDAWLAGRQRDQQDDDAA